MSADPTFVELVRHVVQVRTGRLLDIPKAVDAPNPFVLRFDLNGTIYASLAHVRRITPQEGAGTTHGRPEGEWHAQMIFDGDSRGPGERNYLRRLPDAATVLFGFCTPPGGSETVIAAWDPVHHADYAYSRSLQVREETLIDARNSGIAQQERQTGEIIVAFRPRYLPEYLERMAIWHNSPGLLQADQGDQNQNVPAPPDGDAPRGRYHLSGSRAARDLRFQTFIHDHYQCCATCGLRCEELLDAAHIIPVSEDGSDHYSNGLRLCKNCHALFDAQLLIIRPSYKIELAEDLRNSHPEDAKRLQIGLNEVLAVPEIPDEYRPDPGRLRTLVSD